MRVSQDFVEYIETKVTPRLGAEKTKQWVSWIGESGATRTPFPAQGGQQSGDCGQQVMAA
jgi:hypothetical protein